MTKMLRDDKKVTYAVRTKCHPSVGPVCPRTGPPQVTVPVLLVNTLKFFDELI